MNIEKLINRDAEKHAPYIGRFINHLPMTQFALFGITDDINKVENFTEDYLKKTSIDKVKEKYKQVNSLEACLGERELYESCLDLIRGMSNQEDIEELVGLVLNKYPLGLSSGIFHTIIRVSYAIEGYKLDKNLKPEVERALAYYITGYREGDQFKRKISKEDVKAEMIKLMESVEFKEIRNSDSSLGGKLKQLYGNKNYMDQGFTIEGNEEDKVKGILQILIPAYYNSNNIITLHCITGLQAVVTLKEYFTNYEDVLDIHATTAITHILTQKDLDITVKNTKLEKSWDEVLEEASKSKDIHTIKFAYTNKKLDDLFSERDLKYVTNKRVELEK